MYSIIYYSANRPPEKLARCVRDQIDAARTIQSQVVCVSHRPIDWPRAKCIVRPDAKPGLDDQFLQQLAGLEAASYPFCFFVEDDCLYPRGYFAPAKMQWQICYDWNVWRMNANGAWPDARMIESGCCGQKSVLLAGIKFKLAERAAGRRVKWSEIGAESLLTPLVQRHDTERPYIDIRWGGNLTGMRDDPSKYQADIPYWGSHADVCERLGLTKQETQL